MWIPAVVCRFVLQGLDKVCKVAANPSHSHGRQLDLVILRLVTSTPHKTLQNPYCTPSLTRSKALLTQQIA